MDSPKFAFTLMDSTVKLRGMAWKPLDSLLLILSLVLLAMSLFWVLKPSGSDLQLYVKTSEGEWFYPLDENRDIPLKGPLGITDVHIEDGHVHISDSPCENKTCQAKGSLSKNNQWTACLPNQVFLSLEGNHQEGDVDDQAY